MIPKIAAVVVLYEPNIDVVDNIKTYLEDVDVLYVVDNSEVKNKQVIEAVESIEKVLYVDNGGNQGVAKALNVGARLAIRDQFEWLLTMDQDSSFGPQVFKQYLQCAFSISALDAIAILSPNFLAGHDSKINCLYTQELTVMTSGNLLNLHLYCVIGGFNDKLFIDEVDHEYCLKAHLANLRVVKFENIPLNHQLGNVRQLSLNRKIYNFTVHAPIRHYYISRNFLYVFFTYQRHFTAYAYYRLWRVTRTLIIAMLIGPEKARRFKYIVQGFIDFLMSRMGKCECRF
ncbi:MAG: glycosyltransferase [Geobacter sp.]|nr:MAG: glycosyltransferase [Geobacter sp.]